MANRCWTPAVLTLAALLTSSVLAPAALRAEEADRCQKTEKGAKEREIENRLLAPVNLKYQETPLRQVLNDLSKQKDIDLVPDRVALEEEGISLDRPITLEVQGVSLKSAIGERALPHDTAEPEHPGSAPFILAVLSGAALPLGRLAAGHL
jgi:hypothetical protein